MLRLIEELKDMAPQDSVVRRPKDRVMGVLIEDGKLLVLRMRDAVSGSSGRKWSLAGGTLEYGESIEACLKREMKEETGLDVTVGRLLYLCERLGDGDHVVHMTFLVRRKSGELRVGYEPEPGANEIVDARFVPVEALTALGFSERFQEIAASGFPDAGTYKGSIRTIGL